MAAAHQGGSGQVAERLASRRISLLPRSLLIGAPKELPLQEQLVADVAQAEQKVLCRAATSHAHPQDKVALEELYASGGWQTLLAIAESTRESTPLHWSLLPS